MSNRPAKTRPDPVLAALGRIQDTGDEIRRWLGAEAADLPGDVRAQAVAKLVGAGLQRSVEDLREQLAAVRNDARDLADAERDWRYIFRAQDRLVFTNGLGRTVTFPVGIARLIADGAAVDVELVPGANGLALIHEGHSVAVLPRSFVAQMDRVLGAIDWTAQGAPVPVRGIPGFSGVEKAESQPSDLGVPPAGTPTAGRPS